MLKPGQEEASGEMGCKPVGPKRTLGGLSPQRPCRTIPSPPCKHGTHRHLLAAPELLRSLDCRCLAKHFIETLGWLGLEMKVNATSGPFRHRGTERVP